MTQNVRNTEKKPETQAKNGTEEAGKKNADPAAPKGGAFTVTLGFSSLMTALTALVGCVVVAFMMGVIVGRDDVSSRPTLAEIAEEQDAAVAAALAAAKEMVAQKGATTGATTTGTAPEDTAEGTSSSEAHVMSPEELKYATALKGKNATAQKAASTTASAPATVPATATPTTTTATAPATATTATPSAPASAEPIVDPATALYDYEYQVASLKDETAVDKLRAKLEGEGLRTRMSKIGGYLKVSVHMRGTTAQATALEQRMVELKLGKPVLQGKKMVP